tara:strand:+ start:1045 stop:1329 length:285 start_codon:yes stop_codon:yes gene_type:complete
MSYRQKKQKHESGLSASDMNGLAVLLLEAFKGSIALQLEETGEVNPRLLAEAVKWLSNSGVSLRPDSAASTDLSSLVSSLNFLYDTEEGEVEVK